MGLRVERRLTQLDLETHELLSRKIKVMEDKGDLKAVFDRDELRALQMLGYAKYLAHLKQIRDSLGIDDLSGD